MEGSYRATRTIVALLRIEDAWTGRFDDTAHGGTTQTCRNVWALTGGGQWLLLQNLKLVAELTYGENHDGVTARTEEMWSGTLRLVTAFWPFALPQVHEWADWERES